jgi:hypothetical protein
LAALTVDLKGVAGEVIEEMVKKGFAKTKTEALRYALLQTGEELDLIKPRLHAKAENYAYKEIKQRR